jgi:hypothetical protein
MEVLSHGVRATDVFVDEGEEAGAFNDNGIVSEFWADIDGREFSHVYGMCRGSKANEYS